MAITDFTFTPTVVSEVDYDVAGERDGKWIVFQSGCTREEAVDALAAARLGGPSVTWHLVRRTRTVTEEIIDA